MERLTSVTLCGSFSKAWSFVITVSGTLIRKTLQVTQHKSKALHVPEQSRNLWSLLPKHQTQVGSTTYVRALHSCGACNLKALRAHAIQTCGVCTQSIETNSKALHIHMQFKLVELVPETLKHFLYKQTWSPNWLAPAHHPQHCTHTHRIQNGFVTFTALHPQQCIHTY